MSLSVRAARIELLVISDLTATPDEPYTEADVRAAIGRVVRLHHGVHAAIADAAGELGEHPDLWLARFAWAATTINTVYPAAPRQRRSSVLNSSRTTASV